MKRYQFIVQHQAHFAITRMVVVLQVSRSGFYEWRKHVLSPSRREQDRRRLDEQVADAFASSKERDGAVRIQRELAERGIACTVRIEKGVEISAACGQLRGAVEPIAFVDAARVR